MKVNELVLLNVSLTEDEYRFAGFLTISAGKDSSSDSMTVDVCDIENTSKLKEIKTFFNLDDNHDVIKNVLMEKIVENVSASSHVVDGKDYQEETAKLKTEKRINSLDMA